MTQSGGSRRTVEFQFNVDADTRGLEQFQREFRRLDQVVNVSDETLRELGQELRGFLDTLQQSPRNIGLVRNALTTLSNAATINSTAFRELRGSANELNETLRNVQATARQVASQAISRVPDTANQQIRSLREGLRGLRADSQAYFNTLREIETRQAVIRANEARSRTWASQAAFSSPTMTSGYGSSAQLQSFAPTQAGYNQRISELQQRLANTSFGEPRQAIEREIQRLESELTALINAGADARVNQLAQSAIATRDRLLQVERQLEPLEQQIAARRRRMDELTREISRLGNPESQRLEREIQRRAGRGEDVADLMQQLDGSRSPELLRARAELAQLRAESDAFVDRQLEIANRNAGRDNVDASRMSYNELQSASRALRGELGELEGQLSSLAQRYGSAARAADTYASSTRNAGAASGGTASELLTGRRPEQIVTPGEAYFRSQVVAPPAMLALPAAGESYGSELRRREQPGPFTYNPRDPALLREQQRQQRVQEKISKINRYNFGESGVIQLSPAQATPSELAYQAFLESQRSVKPRLALPAAGESYGSELRRRDQRQRIQERLFGVETPQQELVRLESTLKKLDTKEREYTKTLARIQQLRDQIAVNTPQPKSGPGFGAYDPDAALRYERERASTRNSPGARNRPGTFFQSAGAISAGSFFGGVEGAIGGTLGAAFGGPGAALGAASLGAQVGIIRRWLGGTAELEAQLTKYQIALKNVAGTQAEYERGLAAVESANRRLNIPLLEGTQSFTQLAAAVVGAGGKIKDAEIAYNAVNSAIKATGGSARDVEGAMMAVTQIFSKGKVSAEEVRRQLGDRLPGAFTLFAQSIGKTGPELDKLLREGKVGLNELMVFLVDLQKRYGSTAEEIARSSEDAGARLATAWERARIEIGDALQPIGAEFQESLAKFLTENQEEIKQWVLGFAEIAKGAGSVAVAVGPAALEVGKFVVAMALLRGAMTATAGAYALFTAATTAGGVAITGNVAKVNLLTGATTRLRVATLALAKTWGPALVLTVAISGGAVVLDWLNKLKDAQDRIKQSRDEIRGDAWVQSIGGSAADAATLQKQVQAAGDTYQYLADKIKVANKELESTRLKPRQEFLRQQIAADQAQLAIAESRYKAGTAALGKALADQGRKTTTFPNPTADDSNQAAAADKQLRDEERIAAEQRRLAEANAQLQRRLARQVFEYQVELDQKRYENQRRLLELQKQNEINALPADQRGAAQLVNELGRNIRESLQQLREASVTVNDARQQLSAAQQYESAVTSFAVPSRDAGVGSTTGVYRQGGWGPSGPNTYGAHFDIKRSDRGYFERGALDRYVMVDGRPLSSGVTVTGGRFGAPRKYGPHAGWDYAFGAGAGLSLTGGAKWLGSKPGSYGDEAAFMTPDGKVYKIIHGKFEGGASPGRPAGSQAVRAEISDMRAESSIEESQLRLNQALAVEKEQREAINKLVREYVEDFKIRAFQGVRDQRNEAENELELLKARNRLLIEGARPEVIEFEEKLLSLKIRERAELAGFTSQLSDAQAQLADAERSGNQEKIREYTLTVEGIKAAINGLPEQYAALALSLRNIFDETERLETPTEQYRLLLNQIRSDIEELTRPINQVNSISESLGTSFGQAFSSIVTGSATAKDALANLFSSVADSFAQMAGDILAQWVRLQAVKILGQIFGLASPVAADPLGSSEGVWAAADRALANANGNAFTSNNIVPFAYGGVVDQPTFFKFRQGGMLRNGVAGEAGPEAILPLRRLSNGSLGVQSTPAAGASSQPVVVNISVDARGTKAEGDRGLAGELARDLAAVVDQRLLYHMRPGGKLAGAAKM